MINFNPNTIQNLRSELAAAHAAIEAKYGVKISVGRGKFTSEMVEFTMNVGNVKADGTVINRKFLNLEANLLRLKLTKADLEKVIMLSGMSVKIVGYNPKRRLRPFTIRDVNTGKEYNCTESSIKNSISK
jgi:hypothetical protein